MNCLTNPKVLILGTEETSALPVMWSLAEKKVPFSIGSSRRLSAGTFSRYPLDRFIYPDPLNDEEQFVKWLIGKLKTGQYAVTMGCGWLISFLLSKHKPEFERYTAIPIVDIEQYMDCRDKSRTMKLAAECGVPIPRTWYPADEGIEAVAASASYPAVLKPCISIGARGFSYPRSPEALIESYERIKRACGECIVQEFVPHSGMQYKAELLLNKDHKVALAGSFAKLRYYPPSGGSSSLNKTVHFDEIIRYAKRILVHMKWWGMGDCDFILDPRDNIPKLMEINPRFTRTIRILIEAGLDYPYELYRLALGLEPKRNRKYRDNLFMRYLPADIGWFIASEERFRASPSFFKFFSRDVIYEEWALHDPFTGLGLWLLLAGDMFNMKKLKDRFQRKGLQADGSEADATTLMGG